MSIQPSYFDQTEQEIPINEVNISRTTLSKNNVNKTRTHYRDYYDDETIDVIEKHFEKELNAFDYQFDGEK